jgi:hypothetical protein
MCLLAYFCVHLCQKLNAIVMSKRKPKSSMHQMMLKDAKNKDNNGVASSYSSNVVATRNLLGMKQRETYIMSILNHLYNENESTILIEYKGQFHRNEAKKYIKKHLFLYNKADFEILETSKKGNEIDEDVKIILIKL